MPIFKATIGFHKHLRNDAYLSYMFSYGRQIARWLAGWLTRVERDSVLTAHCVQCSGRLRPPTNRQTAAYVSAQGVQMWADFNNFFAAVFKHKLQKNRRSERHTISNLLFYCLAKFESLIHQLFYHVS